MVPPLRVHGKRKMRKLKISAVEDTSETIKNEGGGLLMSGIAVRIGIVFLLIFGILGLSGTGVLADTCSVSTTVSAQTVAPGGNFDVDISVTTNTPTRGIQFAVSWDPSKVTCNSVEEGTFYKTFAAQNSLTEYIIPSSPAADSTNGKFPSSASGTNISIALLGGVSFSGGALPGPTGTGNVFILHMTAKSGASGTDTFTLSNVQLVDNSSTPLSMNPTVISGQVTISSATVAAPTITDFNPKTGGTGTMITITGTNFTNLTGVTIGGTAAQSYTATSGSSITAVVGQGATGVINVANTGGNVSSSASFNFVPSPTITSFTPTTTGQGKTVTITGTNLTGATAVTFGGTAATIVSNTSTQITATIGTGTSGTVSVTTGGGTATKTGFTFAPAPTISDFSPKTGGVGTAITITGTNFINGGNAVTIGGVVAGITGVPTATQIVATVGAGAASGSVSVTTAGGTATLTGFIYAVQAPTITSFTPTSGAAGTSVTITGTNLSGATTVTFGGTAATIGSDNGTQLVVAVGAGASGTVSVTTPGGTVTKDGFTFTTATSTTTTATTTTSGTTTSTSTTTNPTGTTTSTTTTTPSTTATSTTTTTSSTTTATTTKTQPPITSRTITTTTQPSQIDTLYGTGPVTSLDLSDSMDSGGMLQSDFVQWNVHYSGNNQIVSLSIPDGTRIVGSDGTPVDNISIQAGVNLPAAPTGENIVSSVDLGPNGTTFSSPVTIVFGYDVTQVPHNINANNLALEYFNTQTNKWVPTDYTVDIQNHQITANISHFSLYAIMFTKSNSFLGSGLSFAAILIIFELLLGGLVIYYFLRRKPRPAQTSEQISPPATEINDRNLSAGVEINNVKEPTTISWDDIMPRTLKKGEPFKTHLEIIGGKIIIPNGDSVGIELVNNPDSRILVTLEYDPERYPRGLAKIMVLGTVGSEEYEKSKGGKKIEKN